MNEDVHKKIETHIAASMSGNGIKYALDVEARDFSLPGAPPLMEGADPFIIFQVDIQRGAAAALGNTTKRRIGIVRAELYRLRDSSDREMYAMTDIVTAFLERQTYDGIHFRDAVETGKMKIGKWRMSSVTVNFITTVVN